MHTLWNGSVWISVLMLALGAGFPRAGAEQGAVPAPSRADLEIRFWEKRVSKDSFDHVARTKLGAAYLQKARECGDFSYYLKAEDILEKALRLKPDEYGAQVALAFAYNAQHRFRDGLEFARKALALKPGAPEAHGVLGDAALELGELDTAAKAYAKVLELSPGHFAYSRIANLKVRRGDLPGALESLREAQRLGREHGVPPSELAWCQVQMGDLNFGRGRWEVAEEHYRKALELTPRGYLPLEHLAELRAAQGRHREALEIYRKVIEKAPHPEFFEALADVCRALGRDDDAKKWRERAFRGYMDSVKKGDIGYYRQLALFHLGLEPPEAAPALEWALKDLEVRKDPHTYDTLAWAYYHSGRYDEAARAMKKALAPGAQDAGLYFHAGMIAHRCGRRDEAAAYFEKALEIDPRGADAAAAKKTLKAIRASR